MIVRDRGQWTGVLLLRRGAVGAYVVELGTERRAVSSADLGCRCLAHQAEWTRVLMIDDAQGPKIKDYERRLAADYVERPPEELDRK